MSDGFKCRPRVNASYSCCHFNHGQLSMSVLVSVSWTFNQQALAALVSCEDTELDLAR